MEEMNDKERIAVLELALDLACEDIEETRSDNGYNSKDFNFEIEDLKLSYISAASEELSEKI